MSRDDNQEPLLLRSGTVEISSEYESEEGLTIGLIDSIITAARCLRGRSLRSAAVAEALRDLRTNEEFRRFVVGGLLGFDYDKLRASYEIDALERLMRPSRGVGA